jgi:hypothetical protein
MPGPPPKDPTTRQRTNRVAGAAALEDNRQNARVPPLPKRRGADGAPLPKGDPADWHPLTRAWWRDVWRSPMAARFTKADTHGLFTLAALVDLFQRTPTTQLASEIRQQRACFGLTPIDRWRLQWEVVGDAVPVKKPTAAPAPAPTPSAPGEDPRAILRAVK